MNGGGPETTFNIPMGVRGGVATGRATGLTYGLIPNVWPATEEIQADDFVIVVVGGF